MKAILVSIPLLVFGQTVAVSESPQDKKIELIQRHVLANMCENHLETVGLTKNEMNEAVKTLKRYEPKLVVDVTRAAIQYLISYANNLARSEGNPSVTPENIRTTCTDVFNQGDLNKYFKIKKEGDPA